MAVAVSFHDVSSASTRCGWSVENDARAASTRVLGAGGPVFGRQREHPRKGPGHPLGEWAVVVHRHADEPRGELEHAGAAVRLALRHENERLTVAPSHRDRMVLSFAERSAELNHRLS